MCLIACILLVYMMVKVLPREEERWLKIIMYVFGIIGFIVSFSIALLALPLEIYIILMGTLIYILIEMFW